MTMLPKGFLEEDPPKTVYNLNSEAFVVFILYIWQCQQYQGCGNAAKV